MGSVSGIVLIWLDDQTLILQYQHLIRPRLIPTDSFFSMSIGGNNVFSLVARPFPKASQKSVTFFHYKK